MELVGYKPDDGHASRLAGNGRIQARVAEILSRVAAKTEFTIEKIAEMLVEDRQLAFKQGQAGAAVSASVALAKLHGLWVDRHEHKNKYEHMSDDELTSALARYVREDEELRRGSGGVTH